MTPRYSRTIALRAALLWRRTRYRRPIEKPKRQSHPGERCHARQTFRTKVTLLAAAPLASY